ncbi:MAG: hypothetical protein ACXVFQ_25050 [Solirubrobacteraceae bacterium]
MVDETRNYGRKLATDHLPRLVRPIRRLGADERHPDLESPIGAGVFYGAAVSEARATRGTHVCIVGASNAACRPRRTWPATLNRCPAVLAATSHGHSLTGAPRAAHRNVKCT